MEGGNRFEGAQEMGWSDGGREEIGRLDGEIGGRWTMRLEEGTRES